MKLVMKTTDPYPVSIFIGGRNMFTPSTIGISCIEYCREVGLCVTVTETNYVYGSPDGPCGNEDGYIIGLINYPRFPTDKTSIMLKAEALGKKLLVDLDQQSFTIQGPDFCKWFSRRKEDLNAA